MRDLVEPGVTGDLYPAPDADALARAMMTWAADPTRRRTAGAAAAARARALWTPQHLADRALDLYAAAAP